MFYYLSICSTMLKSQEFICNSRTHESTPFEGQAPQILWHKVILINQTEELNTGEHSKFLQVGSITFQWASVSTMEQIQRDTYNWLTSGMSSQHHQKIWRTLDQMKIERRRKWRWRVRDRVKHQETNFFQFCCVRQCTSIFVFLILYLYTVYHF